MPPHARELLDQGRSILDPVLEPHGFGFEIVAEGKSSGGPVAVGEYRRGDRSVELHVRWALGIVRYRIGDIALDHRDYVACLGGVAAYPGFSDGPLDSFRHLAADLRAVCSAFVTGADDDNFRRCAERVQADPGVFRKHGLPRWLREIPQHWHRRGVLLEVAL